MKFYILICSFFAFSTPSWATLVTTDGGFNFTVTVSANGKRHVEPVDCATGDDRRLAQLEEQVFLQYGALRVVCADDADVKRSITIRRCIRTLEQLLSWEDRADWSVLSGLYLSARSEIDPQVQAAWNGNADIFDSVWLNYEFTLDEALALVKKQTDWKTRQEKLVFSMTEVFGRRVDFHCSTDLGFCARMAKEFSRLDPAAVEKLRQTKYITRVIVSDPADSSAIRLLPSTTFSEWAFMVNALDSASDMSRFILNQL